MTNLNSAISKSYPHQSMARVRQMFSLFIVFVFALMIYPSRAHAQVIDTLEANIPFQFQAGDAVLPAGSYSIRMVEDSGLKFMQITSRDDSSSAYFRVNETDLSSAPKNSELIFNKYGDHYFLAQLFEEGDPSGSEVVKSKYEKTVSKEAAEAKVHVVMQHRDEQGD